MCLRLTLPLLLVLTACAGPPPLAEPSGPLRALNAGRWTPTEEDLRGPRTALPPERPASPASEVRP